ncbi:hypothetical protein BXY70_1295 [Roseovarius halotolerans]|uniref:Sulfotransferase family protein n=1 Tax=Roseovarius halotolerans TaxID=505353 RepID=A0A1X6Y5J8_9RHOB|nr:hypothetical protein [Roseovarius halotolerans]RKT35264.1 hypothetical protein BXY70_1295 [Roseovarius halotolerans]SLN11391.1 hypothetical protein ROH8110_00099 [Roseovarius halotolerans]
MFLENLIARHCPGVTAEHEPSPSRYLMMLGNMRNDWGVMACATRRLARYHQEKHHGKPGKYIEINPFLCPVTDLLAATPAPIRIVHMLRSPGAWAQSMTTFKASTRYRHVIDYVPFAKPYPAPRPKDWNRLSPFAKGLHRWNWCNTRIAALEPVAQSYIRVRCEDLFSEDPERSRTVLAGIFATLDLPFPERLASEEFQLRVNPAPQGDDLRDPPLERAICGKVAAAFGYDL